MLKFFEKIDGLIKEWIKNSKHREFSDDEQAIYDICAAELAELITLSKPNCLQYKIVCLCGSTKFKDEFMITARDLTLNGHIVLMPNVFIHKELGILITNNDKERLDNLHKAKIDMADWIFIINKGNYIGKSTKSEIEYAKKNNKTICYLENWSQPILAETECRFCKNPLSLSHKIGRPESAHQMMQDKRRIYEGKKV